MQRARVLILWNQVDEDVVELWRRDGRRTPDWDPTKIVEEWDTVAEEIELLEKSVREGGHDVVAVNIRDSFETLFQTITTERPDAIVNLIEWFHDDIENEMHVAALFELLGVAYTGNRPIALSLCQKKPHAKALLAAAGLPVPKGIVVEKGAAPADLALRYPLIVKPAYDDASGGIDAGSVVRDRAALDKRVQLIVGDHKMAVWDDMNNLEPIRYYDKGVTADHYSSFGEFHMILRDGAITIPKVKLSEPLLAQDQEFIACLRQGRRPAASGEFATEVVRAVEAALESVRQQGRAVKLGPA